MKEDKNCCKTCLYLMEDYFSGQFVCRRCSECYGDMIVPHDLDKNCLNYKYGGDMCEYW